MTYSNQYANPATVGLISYMGVLYNFMVDLIAFDVVFGGLQICGICVCMTFSISAAVYKIKTQGKEQGADKKVG